MFCSKCGREIPEIANVFPYCGYSVKNNTSPERAEAPKYDHIIQQPQKSTFKKICSTMSVIGTIILIIFGIRFWTMDKTEMMHMLSGIVPTYSMIIRDDTPDYYNTSLTYGDAFERYFSDGTWEEGTNNNGNPFVKYIGIFDNQDGTYSKAEVFFDITDLNGGEFYYNIDTVIIDGLDLGSFGVYGLMEDIFNSR